MNEYPKQNIVEHCALEHEGSNDYILREGIPSVWITVDNVKVHIVRGSHIAVFRKGRVDGDALMLADTERSKAVSMFNNFIVSDATPEE